jgi:hypothetical protein
LNELQEKLGGEGLTIVGVTGEPKGPTEKWVKDKGAKYGYAYDKGGAFFRAVKAGGYPHAVLVDATGKIAWTGHPGNLQEDAVRGALTGALKKPLWELPKDFAKFRAAIGKDQLSAALKELDALAKAPNPPADLDVLKGAVQSMLDGRLAGAKAAGEAGDWASAKEGYERLAKAAAGLPVEKDAKDALAELGKNADAQKGLKAQKELAGLLEMPEKKEKERTAKVDALKAFAKKYGDSFAGKKAAEAAEALSAAK